MNIEVELEQESDGRWIADVPPFQVLLLTAPPK